MKYISDMNERTPILTSLDKTVPNIIQNNIEK